ncbi:hypothetical protein H257_05569 [Aphanomyces astaci]|uniref:Cytochrome b5 heme-binding domain-containing protein n=1 Tax=Aphanomyces astaci TaxID=112090 RepID=W4GQR9_APHAT|nr:hypothetical protein H257_05569 [Aphanomyces astaci]ETV82050.1 hypothetical protein H257_05569 [Aphanomyces astaci]|eukprot:XP_009828787.1 hypothetical protein H257_05569 [Aphanomyces astaci]
MAKSRWFLGLAVVIGILGVFWPQIEEILFKSCPITFMGLREPKPRSASSKLDPTHDVSLAQLPLFTVEELQQYDGSDESRPIYMAVGGIVLDVTSGGKFYKKGAEYNQFAGQACTRALALASLDVKDINDITSDFTPAQQKDLDETLTFYHGKYPKVGVLAVKRFPENT